MTAADFYCLLEYLWKEDRHVLRHERYRVQFALIMQLSAYCASRPGEIVESSAWTGSNDALKFKVRFDF